jgi:16S rRNA processing protein RimM
MATSSGAAVVTDTEVPAWPEDAIEVGFILDAWGVKGWVKVQTFASDPQAIFTAKHWFLKAPEPGGFKRPLTATAPYPPVLHITQVKVHGDGLVALPQSSTDRNSSEALRGARIFVPRASFPKASTDEFYWVDLIGLNVVNREGEALGSVVGLIDTGPHSVLRIVPVGADPAVEATQRLIPFVSQYVDDVSLPQRLITVDWGLDY